MNTKPSSLAVYFLVLLVTLLLKGQPAGAAENMISIFNGKDLQGWKVPDPNPFWSVVGGVLVGENDEKLKGNVIYTEASYGDFVLESKVRWTGEIDSGFMMRRPELQLQLGVSRSLKRDMTASFYTGGQERYPEAGQAKAIGAAFKEGEWNHFRIQAKGTTFTVWVNGTQVTQYTNPKYSEAGPIGLQVHPGLKMKVEFSDLRVREL